MSKPWKSTVCSVPCTHFLKPNIVHIVGYSTSVCKCKHRVKIIPPCDSQSPTLLFCSLYDNAHRKDVWLVQPVSYQPPIVCWVNSSRTSQCRGECFWTEKASERRVEGVQAGMEALQGRHESDFMTNLWQQWCEFKTENDSVLCYSFFSVVKVKAHIYNATSGYYIQLAQTVVRILSVGFSISTEIWLF